MVIIKDPFYRKLWRDLWLMRGQACAIILGSFMLDAVYYAIDSQYNVAIRVHRRTVSR